MVAVTHARFATDPKTFAATISLTAASEANSKEQPIGTPSLPPGFDFTDPDIYARRLPVQELAELRRTAPIWWNEQPPDQGGFGDGGYWVVTKLRDIREVSLRNDIFSSAAKSIVPRYRKTRRRARSRRGARR